MAQRKTTSQPVANESAMDDTVKETKQKITAKDVDLHEYIPVRNGFVGTLVYISPRTGEQFVWEGFGDEQEIELQELKNAKAANKKFFERNWFMFDKDYDWVIDYLGVGAFYNNAIGIDNFDSLFEKKPEEIVEIVGNLSAGQKKSISYRARQLIADGAIDSMRVIDALEKSLGIDLIEK